MSAVLPILSRLTIRRRRGSPAPWGVALALVALCLRLAWPAPVPTSPNVDLAVALGEHALCLAAAAEANGQPTDAPQPGDHADHDGLGCCQWHAAAGFVLPPAAALVRVVYQARALVPSVAAQTPPARYSNGSGQARAPPS